MDKFTNFLTTFITILIMLLWLLPGYMAWLTKQNDYSMLYIIISIITITWGSVVYKKYYK